MACVEGRFLACLESLRRRLLDRRTEIDIVESATSPDFVQTHYVDRNIPCLWQGIASKWKCTAWIRPDGRVDTTALIDTFGDIRVPLEEKPLEYENKDGGEGYGAKGRRDLPLSEAIHCMNNVTSGQTAYIKDWHFVLSAPQAKKLYEVPEPFQEDFLNEYYDFLQTTTSSEAGTAGVKPDDYRFCYFGTAGSWTPLHHDVMYSCSWSANVTGTKLWLFYSPETSTQFYDAWDDLRWQCTLREDEQMALYDLLLPSVPKTDTGTLHELGFPSFFIIQHATDAVFVPPGWHHEVYNLEETLSINHNWFGSAALPKVCCHLAVQLEKVRNRLSDCKPATTSGDPRMAEWEQEVQMVLKANDALNLDDMATLCLQQASKLADSCSDGFPVVTKFAQILAALRWLLSDPYILHAACTVNDQSAADEACHPAQAVSRKYWAHSELNRLANQLESMLHAARA